MHGPGRPIGALTFTTTMWMVIRVHNGTTYSRADTHVTLTSCFTDLNKVVITITDQHRWLRGSSTEPFAFRRTEVLSVAYFPSFSHELCAVYQRNEPSVRPCQDEALRCVPEYQPGYSASGKQLPTRNLCVCTAHNLHAICKSCRSKDVCLLAVCVADQMRCLLFCSDRTRYR